MIQDQYWKRNEECNKFVQEVKLHNYRFIVRDFIAKEMKKVKSLDIGCWQIGLGTEANIDIAYPPIIPNNFQIMDAHHLDFPDNSFEAVSIVEVIEHVENPSQVLREIYRVLKKDGQLFLTTPNPAHISIVLKRLRNKRMRNHCDHLHTWHWEMLAWLIHTIGFRDVNVHLWGHINEMRRKGESVKLYRSYRLANLLYSLGIRNPMLHLNIFIKCRK